MSDRYARQSFLGEDSQHVLSAITIGIVGLGGGGSHIAQQLAHIGIGRIVLFDPDRMDFPNLNRTVGSTIADVEASTLKVSVAERTIRTTNDSVGVLALDGRWQDHLETLRDCDVIFGCIDGLLPRKELEDSCRRAMLPLIDVGMDVHPGAPFSISGQVIASIPEEPCFRCVHFIRDGDIAREESAYGQHAGGTPQVIWANGVLASTAVGLFMQMVTPWFPIGESSLFLGYDGNAMTLEKDPRFGLAEGRVCLHYTAQDLGDPFWTARI